MQFHLLSFEGPDAYSSTGGIATRVSGLARALAKRYETHLWFVGDPTLAGHEQQGNFHLHRWCQWLSEHHAGGVYDGEVAKINDYAASLPHALLPFVRERGPCVVIGEDWHTAHAMLHLHGLLRRAELRDQVQLLWNVNNTVGFGRIDWEQLTDAVQVTTVSRYMRGLVRQHGVEALVIPNGLDEEALAQPDPREVALLQRAFAGRLVLAKLARWVVEKRWTLAIEIVSQLKAQGKAPLLLARSGYEPHRREILARAERLGLRLGSVDLPDDGVPSLAEALSGLQEVDVAVLERRLSVRARSAVFAAADAVLANSSHEPFGMVGLEVMAAGGVACVGCTGEEYAMPGFNSLVVQTEDPREFGRLWNDLGATTARREALVRAARATAERFAWDDVVDAALLPRLEKVHRKRA